MGVSAADSSRRATCRCAMPRRRRPGRAYVFNANQPVRYFAVVVSRLTRVTDMVVDARDSTIPVAATFDRPGGPGAELRRYDRISIGVEANPRQLGRGRDIAPVGGRHHAVLRNADGRHAVRVADGDDARARCAGRPQSGVLFDHQQRRAVLEAVLGQRPVGVCGRARVLPRARARSSVVGTGGRLEELPRAVDQRGIRAILFRAVRPARPRRRVILRHAAPVPPVEPFRVGPGADRSWLSPRADSGSGPDLPRRHLQQGRVRPAHASPLRRRRGVLQWTAPLLRGTEVSEGGDRRFPAAPWRPRQDGRSIASSIDGSMVPTCPFCVIRPRSGPARSSWSSIRTAG